MEADFGLVCLGKSGLKVSRIILGTMSYGSQEWNSWVLGEEEGVKHIKAASANVCFLVHL
jgi:aryl-alcohol dehydrogenase-like predicted oxidoreductase